MKGGRLARVWWGGKAWGNCAITPVSHSGGMANSSEPDSEELRRFLDKARERSADYSAIELRLLFPGVTDNVQARECARVIAGWKPLPTRPPRRQGREP